MTTITVSLPYRDAVRLGVAQTRELTIGPETSQRDRDEIVRRVDDGGQLYIDFYVARHLTGAADIAEIAAAYRTRDRQFLSGRSRQGRFRLRCAERRAEIAKRARIASAE